MVVQRQTFPPAPFRVKQPFEPSDSEPSDAPGLETTPSNREIGRALEEAADILDRKGDNPFRVRAFRNAARTILNEPRSVALLARSGGPSALRELPGIGTGLAALVDQFVRSGGATFRYRALGDVSPYSVLTSLPGIGPVLARRILDELRIRDLEDLEQAIYDGSLRKVRGFGARRTVALRYMLNSLLSRRLQERTHDLSEELGTSRPPVELLLRIDEEYRRRVEEDALPRIAPRRFNPGRLAWLPLWQSRTGGWTFRALFSNTPQAHALGKTRDWVVLYYERAGEGRSSTVVTETRGRLAGHRVVRGREAECAEYYGLAPGLRPRE